MTNDYSSNVKFVVLDFETTGFSSTTDYIIEIGAAKYNGSRLIDTFSSYIKPPIPIPLIVTNKTGISDTTVSCAPNIKETLPKLLEFISNYDIVCHNAPFDISFLKEALLKAGLPQLPNIVYDTLPMCRECIQTDNHKLETLKNHFGLLYSSHSALEDCKTTAYVYLHCLDKNIPPMKYFSPTQRVESRTNRNNNNIFTKEELELIRFVGELFKVLSISDVVIIRNSDSIEFCDEYPFLKIKIGKKKYLLVRKNIDELRKLYPNAPLEPGSKKEGAHNRILLFKNEDILNYSNLIKESHKICQNSKQNYFKIYKTHKTIPNSLKLDELIK